MGQNFFVGIDIGSYNVRVLVAKKYKGEKFLRVLGSGTAESKGVRHGYIDNLGEVTQSISEAIYKAEQNAKVKIKKAYVSVGGIGLSSFTSGGSMLMSNPLQTVSQEDLDKVLEISEQDINQNLIQNRKIIYAVPTAYKIDGKLIIGNPIGIRGNKLEVKTLFITCLKVHVEDLIESVELLGVKVERVVAAPVAASFVTLKNTQKNAGVVLVNIGSETLSIVVFENNIPISLEVLQVGGNNITNDIALGLKISLSDAEEVKMGTLTTNAFSKKQIEEIVDYRMMEIFDLVNNHLKKIDRVGVLPAGIVVIGGGSKIKNIEELAKKSLKISSKIGKIECISKENIVEYGDSSWSNAYGLCINAFFKNDINNSNLLTKEFYFNNFSKFRNWISQFLP